MDSAETMFIFRGVKRVVEEENAGEKIKRRKKVIVHMHILKRIFSSLFIDLNLLKGTN